MQPRKQESVVIICQCAVVSDRVVTETVVSGARSLAQVCRATGAGRDCGACVFSVKRVISEVRHGALCLADPHFNGENGRRSSDLMAKSA
jgi:bacterioferritin-associated ferredoxin